jgi:hypothetical protein
MPRFTLQSSATINPTIYDHRSTSSDASKQSLDSIIKNQVLSDKMTNSTSKNVNQFLCFSFYSFILFIENFKLPTSIDANID